MTDITSKPESFGSPEDADAALKRIIDEIGSIRTAIESDQPDIDRLKAESRAITARTDESLALLRAQLAKLTRQPIEAA